MRALPLKNVTLPHTPFPNDPLLVFSSSYSSSHFKSGKVYVTKRMQWRQCCSNSETAPQNPWGSVWIIWKLRPHWELCAGTSRDKPRWAASRWSEPTSRLVSEPPEAYSKFRLSMTAVPSNHWLLLLEKRQAKCAQLCLAIHQSWKIKIHSCFKRLRLNSGCFVMQR